MGGLVAGVDSSTQSTKVELRNLDDGSLVARASATHPPTSPPVSEQDPEAWWDALVSCFAQLEPSDRSEVRAVAVAGQQHGLVLLDADGAALRPAKLWNDTTSAPQAERLVAALGATAWAEECGSVPLAAFTIAKLAWVAEHEPALLARVDKVMLPHDYLTWRLSGRHVSDRGDASGTGWFDPATNTYRPALLDQVGDVSTWLPRLPEILAPAETVGPLSAGVSDMLGLAPQVVVGPGSGDNMGAALGLGLQPGDVVISLGTSGTVYGVSTTPTADPSGCVAGFADANGQFLPLVCTLNATKVTDSVARWLGTDAPGLAELALQADGDDDPVLIPWFDGERTPNLPSAFGEFLGLRNHTTREQLARAAHDGVLCSQLGGVDALEAAGVAVTGRTLLIGGGARSVAYRQRAADLTNAPVLIPDADETVATGAAVQAAMIASGSTAPDLAAAWHLGRGTTIEPKADRRIVRERYVDAAGRSADHHRGAAS